MPWRSTVPSEALALIEDGERFDVAVLDLVMPEMDGLRARHAGSGGLRDERELPLVLLTSLGRAAAGAVVREFVAQLTKPIKASQLYNALMSALAGPAPEAAAVGEAATATACPRPRRCGSSWRRTTR